MPIKTVSKRHSRAPRHKHTKVYLQTYWPYLPMMLIVLVGLFLSGTRPLASLHKGVLAYAIDTTQGGLLDATNAQRNDNGQASLKLNQQLINAAQAKANDMIARNYWSHNTPDGQTPWTFIQGAGYVYTKAGENLAYGFATSPDTITGWMNSPTHKANLLDSAFSEVGFGMANGSDYNSSGPETVVVAMYGQPQVLSASNQAPVPAAPAAKPVTQPVQVTPKTVEPAPQPAPTSTKVDTTVASTKPVVEPASKTITRAGLLTHGRTPWIVGSLSLVTGLSVLLLLIRHGWGFRRMWLDGEQFVIKHPLVDVLLVTLIMLGYVLSATQGIIK